MKKSLSRIFLFSLLFPLVLHAQPSFKKDIGWAFFRDLTHESFAEKFDHYRGRGYLLKDIDAYKTPSGTRYAMIWEKNNGSRHWAEYRGLTNNEYHAKWEEYKSKGFRPADIEGYDHNGGLKFAGIWVENKENYRWNSRRGMTAQQFEAYITEQENDGKRMVDMEAYQSGNSLHYASIFIENKEDIKWEEGHGLSRTNYENKVDVLTRNGFIIVNYEAYTDNGNLRYAYIAEKRSGYGYQLRTERTELQFANLWREYDDIGYRIIDFECYPTPNGMRYGGVWIENDDRYSYNKRKILDSIINKYRVDSTIPGISVAIIKDGKMIYRKGAGFADKEAGKVAYGETIYLTASVAKVIAGTLAVKLYARQKMQDETPINFNLNNTTATYLTRVRKSDGRIVTIPAHHTHTVKQVFSHLACIHNYGTGPSPAVRQYARSIDVLTQFWDTPLIPGCSMGQDRNYSNYGYVFAAAVLENVTGRSSPSLIKDELAIPYGLKTLRAINEAANIPYNYDRAIPYKSSDGSPTQHNNKSWKVFVGGLELSTVDLCRFGWKLLNGEIVRPAARDSVLWKRVNPAENRGISWIVSGDEKTVWHDGSWEGARSMIKIYREEQLVFAIMSNQDDHSINVLMNAITDAVRN